VQNLYNVARRNDDGFIDELAQKGIAYVPLFPLGGFTPLQSSKLDATAVSLQVTPMQVALAWLLQRSPNILLIPGTSSVGHLRENLKAATRQLPPKLSLDSIGAGAKRLEQSQLNYASTISSLLNRLPDVGMARGTHQKWPRVHRSRFPLLTEGSLYTLP
jgi:aryl-alcohol dehydrogenase-like predicted oxidoreductase